MAIIDTNGQFENLETLLGVDFEIGNVYTFQAEHLCYLKIGNYDECTIKQVHPFAYKADGEGLKIKTPVGNPCLFKLISVSEG